MSSDKIPACWDVLCFVDKAIIHHYASDSKIRPPSQAYACDAWFTHRFTFAVELYSIWSFKNDFISYVDCRDSKDIQ